MPRCTWGEGARGIVIREPQSSRYPSPPRSRLFLGRRKFKESTASLKPLKTKESDDGAGDNEHHDSSNGPWSFRSIQYSRPNPRSRTRGPAANNDIIKIPDDNDGYEGKAGDSDDDGGGWLDSIAYHRFFDNHY